ncbi:hypothetical protein M8818_002587 [Zalaria obscura]|uniref:Uncharacterized protein n=1 Tax=Zalaria obscura TaxID=2024903 RepID=A0ACC3SGA8_9PEZI
MGICDASPFWVVNKVKPPKVNNELQCQAHPNSREMLKQPHDDPAFSQELSTVVTCFMPGRLASISDTERDTEPARVSYKYDPASDSSLHTGSRAASRGHLQPEALLSGMGHGPISGLGNGHLRVQQPGCLTYASRMKLAPIRHPTFPVREFRHVNLAREEQTEILENVWLM